MKAKSGHLLIGPRGREQIVLLKLIDSLEGPPVKKTLTVEADTATGEAYS